MQIVRVTWWDACDHKASWVHEADAQEFGAQTCTIISVGFVVRKTDKYLTLSGDWDEVDQDHGRVEKIPIGVIQLIEELVPVT